MRSLFALIAGSVFGLGLMISGMTDTNKVQGWLDLLGAWDPSLAFVLGGAMIPMLSPGRWPGGAWRRSWAARCPWHPCL